MASAQMNCKVRVYARKPTGQEELLLNSTITVLAPGGGSPDGALASVPSIEKRHVIPVSVQTLRNEDRIRVEITNLGTTDGVDASDCIWSIPIQTQSGTQHLTTSDFTDLAFGDLTATLNVPQTVAMYKITEGPVKFGGSHIYLDIQNDTA